MKKNPAISLGAALVGVVAALTTTPGLAQEPLPAAAAEDAAVAGDDSYYYAPTPERAPTPSLAVQKAQLRGAQRMARLEAMRWYGFSGSRPTAAAIPWTTMYSPAWQMPGGRPFAWYMRSRPVIVIAVPPPTYR
jgi:hypothetical protein